MNTDFHYYATYCAAILAGYSHEDSLKTAYASAFADYFSATYLGKIKGPVSAATTQLQMELMDARTDVLGLQNITRIWASFHFLPYDTDAEIKRVWRGYRDKYRLICNVNGPLLAETVKLVKGKTPAAAGLAMHVLCDTWAHRYFAGTPSLVINNVSGPVSEIVTGANGLPESRRVTFRSTPSLNDAFEKYSYNRSISQMNEISVMNLGHARLGRMPDYSYLRYTYMPAWGQYEEILKDNQSDYYKAFCQTVYALKFIRGDIPSFETDTYDYAAAEPYEREIKGILAERRLDAGEGWKALGERLSGREIEDFNIDRYQSEYTDAPSGEKGETFLGRFISASLAQKSMVTNAIYKSGNLLAGFPWILRRKNRNEQI